MTNAPGPSEPLNDDATPPKGKAARRPAKRAQKTATAQKKQTGAAKRSTKSPKGKAKRGRGRPRRLPTPEQIDKVEKFARLGMDVQDIAWAIDFPRSTFYDYLDSHFSDAIKRGKARLKLNSGMVFVREMNKGNMTAGIWLEKTRLGITEKVHTIVPLPGGGSGEAAAALGGPVNVIAIGLYLPPNGRDVPAAGQTLPKELQVAEVPAPVQSVGIVLPSNNREVRP